MNEHAATRPRAPGSDVAAAAAPPPPAQVRALAWLPLAGVALLVLGIALVIGGVVLPALFMPGVYVLVLGFLTVFAAGVVAVLPEPAARTPARPRGA